MVSHPHLRTGSTDRRSPRTLRRPLPVPRPARLQGADATLCTSRPDPELSSPINELTAQSRGEPADPPSAAIVRHPLFPPWPSRMRMRHSWSVVRPCALPLQAHTHRPIGLPAPATYDITASSRVNHAQRLYRAWLGDHRQSWRCDEIIVAQSPEDASGLLLMAKAAASRSLSVRICGKLNSSTDSRVALTYYATSAWMWVGVMVWVDCARRRKSREMRPSQRPACSTPRSTAWGSADRVGSRRA